MNTLNLGLFFIFSVAQSVLLKENHMLNGVRLVVKETVQRRGVTQSKVYKDKVFVTGKIIEFYLCHRRNPQLITICTSIHLWGDIEMYKNDKKLLVLRMYSCPLSLTKLLIKLLNIVVSCKSILMVIRITPLDFGIEELVGKLKSLQICFFAWPLCISSSKIDMIIKHHLFLHVSILKLLRNHNNIIFWVYFCVLTYKLYISTMSNLKVE